MIQDMNETYGHTELRNYGVREEQGCRHTLGILFEYAWSMARVWLEAGKSMARVWLRQLKVESLKLKVSLYSSRDKMSIERVGGIQGEFTQNSRGIQAEFDRNSGRIPVDGSKMVRRWFEDGSKMIRRWLGANNLVPHWDQNSPTLGTKQSHVGTKTGLQLALDEITARASRDYGSLASRLRLVVTLLLLMVVGIGEMWGDEDPYEGIWYINNQRLPDDGYYFVPTINCFYNGDEDQPHLTTFKTGKDKNSIWRIEAVSDGVYRIIHNATGKYLMVNDAVPELANGNAHRKRVHLQTLTPQELEDLDNNPTTDKSLFTLVVMNPSPGDADIVAIKSKNVGSGTTGDGTDHLYLNPRGNNSGDFDFYRAKEGRDITHTTGIVGFYGNDTSNKPSDQAGSRWKLETATSTCANPVIKYIDIDGDTQIQISYPISSDTGWKIYYTIDGSDPSDATNENRTEITSTATLTNLTGVSKVRAIATKTGWNPSDESFLITSGITRLVQSKECDAFYMVPPIVDGDLTCATTTNIPHAKMGWNFVPAGLYCGIQYYNIINKETGEYLYCSKGNGQDEALTMMSNDAISTPEQIDRAKFRLIVQADGSYKVISKWWAAEKPNAYYVNKKNGNNGGNAINLADGNSNTALWNVIAAPSSPKTQFDASFASSSSSAHFYEIQSATDEHTYHVIPPTTSTGKATANTTGANPTWFFMPVNDDDTWIPYYHIRNGKTGEYLYYNSGSFYTSLAVESDNEDRYMFVVVKSAYTTDPTHYNVIPKALKDQAKQASNSLNRNGTTLRILDSRNTPASNWKFKEVDLFCNDPVFTEAAGAISISCVPDITRIYYTTDGTNPDPTNEDQRYVSTTPLSTTNKLCIKAISVVSNESTSASSAVITLLNKPDVTLAGGPYTYKAADWEPSVTLSVGTTQTTTGFSTTYANQKNAGTANVTITDNEASDAWYIWNVPVTEFTIDKASLTITAKPKSIGYGDEPDNDGVTYVGFVGEPAETETVLEGTLEYSYTTTGDDPHSYIPYDPQYGNQGSYVITPSGLTSTNYNITFMPGTMTVTAKSIGDGALAEGFTLEFDEDGNVILKYGSHTLTKDVDYTITIDDENSDAKYSTRTINGTGNDSGEGNYTGSLPIRNAIVHFTTDANQEEWSATFVAETANTDFGHTLPNDISAYIITDIEGSWAIPEPLDYIPTGIPVLLVAHEAKNGFVVTNVNKNDVSQDVQDAYELKKGYNMLKEVTDATSGYVTNTQSEYYQKAHFSTKQIYVLYNNEFVLNKDGYLDKGKVYMENPTYVAPSPSPAPTRLKIKWDNVSGIAELRNDGLTESRTGIGWYTIDGRRLNGKPSAKGLYIVNGKKVMVK